MPTTEPTPASRVPAGLLAAGTPVPLEGVSVNALVTSASARVTIAQRYRNLEQQPRVGRYGLALHVEDCDVTDDAPAVQFLRRSEAAHPPPKASAASLLGLRLGRSLREAFGRENPGQRAARPPLVALVALQRADGSWELTEKLARAVGVEWTHLTSASVQVSGTPDDGRVWATMVALAWLARHADESRDEWLLLAQKAEGWLSATVRDRAPLARWRPAAEALVNA